ncbi:hypothetical protein BJY21_000960 [Kineosphaera limosa]|uniref:Uncharacterized protein n=1 Tax=Kineosphaera limosa NBRC 100340 TaxID=1184609 RepID=K6WPZ6_9MICO|nr:hypothetical protein [Kineosphaera limosa]NYD99775.1 hypothetical protein [Kineosphaera limosa]GAB95876.1 hypothetical protein KILIM_028_00300 [Kineosphaera limosa NBRC 100340]
MQGDDAAQEGSGEQPEEARPRSSGRHRRPPNPRAILWARVAIVGLAAIVLVALLVEVVRLTADPTDKVTAAQPGSPGHTSPSDVASAPTESDPPRGGEATVPPTSPASPTDTPSPTQAPTQTPGTPDAPDAPAVTTPAGAPQPAAQLAAAQLARLHGLVAAANTGAPVATAPLGEHLVTVPGRQIGEWERTTLENGMTLAANNDRAVRSGRLVTHEAFPRATSEARVRLPDGQRYTAPVASAYETFMAMRAIEGPACETCRDIVLTSVKATTMSQDTDAGKVTLPAWEYTVRDSRVKLVRPAVTDAGLVRFTPDFRGAVPPAVEAAQLPLWRTSLSADKRVISAGIERRDVAERGGCWRLFASETDEAVAIYAAQGPADAAGACATPIGNVSVRLAAPLGDRTIVDTYWERALSLR